MPRTARASAADYCYHALNRGNGRAEVFHKAGDFEAFAGMIAAASARLPMRVLGYCVMPSHFHLVLRPYGDGDLGRWMQWLLTTHVRRYRKHYGSSGHVWQGRFKAFPCQNDDHLVTVLRYVERNALRAGLVARAEDWPHGSLRAAAAKPIPVVLEPGPVPRDAAWIARVNRPMNELEVAALRKCIARGTPYGTESWVRSTAASLGLESSLRPIGRPKKTVKK
jgi:putative transposase